MASFRFLLALATLAGIADAWWKDLPPHERGEPPYPYPTNREYKVISSTYPTSTFWYFARGGAWGRTWQAGT